jgi:hypothetical protein
VSRSRAAWLWGLGLFGAVSGAAAWLALQSPAPGSGGAPVVAGAPVAFELAVDSLARGAVRLPQPGFRGRGTRPGGGSARPGGGPGEPLDVGAVTPVSGLVLVIPPALRPPSPEDGARILTVTLLRDGREVGTRQCRFYALGDAVRLRPAGRLEGGDYDLRFALAPLHEGERPIVWFFPLRVR